MESLEELMYIFYTGIIKASPIDCFYLILSSEFYGIQEEIIVQCVTIAGQLTTTEQIKEIIDNLNSIEALNWLLTSKILSKLCNNEMQQKINKKLNMLRVVTNSVERSPALVQLQLQVQTLQSSLQQHVELLQTSVQDLSSSMQQQMRDLTNSMQHQIQVLQSENKQLKEELNRLKSK